jgi:hypothetical protein
MEIFKISKSNRTREFEFQDFQKILWLFIFHVKGKKGNLTLPGNLVF